MQAVSISDFKLVLMFLPRLFAHFIIVISLLGSSGMNPTNPMNALYNVATYEYDICDNTITSPSWILFRVYTVLVFGYLIVQYGRIYIILQKVQLLSNIL